MPSLADHIATVSIDLKKLLFLRNLKGIVELDNGVVLGRRASLA